MKHLKPRRASGGSLTLSTGVPQLIISAASLSALGGEGPLLVSIAQIGTNAASLPPATLSLPIGD